MENGQAQSQTIGHGSQRNPVISPQVLLIHLQLVKIYLPANHTAVPHLMQINNTNHYSTELYRKNTLTMSLSKHSLLTTVGSHMVRDTNVLTNNASSNYEMEDNRNDVL